MRVYPDYRARLYSVVGTLAEWHAIQSATSERTYIRALSRATDDAVEIAAEYAAIAAGVAPVDAYNLTLPPAEWLSLVPAALLLEVLGQIVTPDRVTRNTEFHFARCCRVTIGARGGMYPNVERWRVNGQVKTWATRPGDFRIPIKSGLRECSYLTHNNAAEFHAAADCPYGL